MFEARLRKGDLCVYRVRVRVRVAWGPARRALDLAADTCSSPDQGKGTSGTTTPQNYGDDHFFPSPRKGFCYYAPRTMAANRARVLRKVIICASLVLIFLHLIVIYDAMKTCHFS